MTQKQSGKGLAGNLAKIGLEIGFKAIKSSLGKRLIYKGVDNIPNIFKYDVSKTKNKNLKKSNEFRYSKHSSRQGPKRS